MSESTITFKGQTTVLQPIREFLNAQAGTKLHWHLMPDGTITLRVKTKSIADLAGMLKKMYLSVTYWTMTTCSLVSPRN